MILGLGAGDPQVSTRGSRLGYEVSPGGSPGGSEDQIPIPPLNPLNPRGFQENLLEALLPEPTRPCQTLTDPTRPSSSVPPRPRPLQILPEPRPQTLPEPIRPQILPDPASPETLADRTRPRSYRNLQGPTPLRPYHHPLKNVEWMGVTQRQQIKMTLPPLGSHPWRKSPTLSTFQGPTRFPPTIPHNPP